jgi:hypothetical protein
MDHMGLGKGHFLLSMILMFERRAHHKSLDEDMPSAVVCPNTIKDVWGKTKDALPNRWAVYSLNQSIGKQKGKRVLLDRSNAIFTAPNRALTVVVMTYEQLSGLKADGEKHGGVFSRIYLDEASAIRRCSETERGRLLMALNVPSRWLFSDTLI